MLSVFRLIADLLALLSLLGNLNLTLSLSLSVNPQVLNVHFELRLRRGRPRLRLSQQNLLLDLQSLLLHHWWPVRCLPHYPLQLLPCLCFQLLQQPAPLLLGEDCLQA